MKNYTDEIIQHNMHPIHKHELEHSTCELDGVNPSCGDEITLKLNVEDGVIRDGAFVGDGCAVSQASADIMLEEVIGKPVEEVKQIISEFESSDHFSVSPSRYKCVMLGWNTLKEMIGG